MTTILAIETSTDLASVALLHEGQFFSRETSGVQTHSRAVLPGVQSVLQEAGITLRDCKSLAFSCGPGAFTGVRTACAMVQGMAFPWDLPVVPVVSLQAMAEAARTQHGCENVIVVADARLSEVYWAQYCYRDGMWLESEAPQLGKGSDVLTAWPPGVTLVYGKGVDVSAIPDNAPRFHCEPHARHVAQLAAVAFANGLALDAADAQPLYVRNKIALTTTEREQGKAS